MSDYNDIKPILVKSFGGIALIFLFLLSIFSGCIQQSLMSNDTVMEAPKQKIIFNDTLGNLIELSHPAERIIVNYESSAEMLITIGAADNIVGIDYATKPYRKDITEKLRSDVKNIGDYSNFYVEILSQMHPEDIDVIIGTSSSPKNLAQLQSLNPRSIVYFKCRNLEQLNNEAYALGEMTGHREGAQRYIRFNQKYQELVESRLTDLSEEEIPTVYGIYGTSQGFVVTPDSPFGGQIISILHARNANGDLNVSPATVNPEWIFQKDPDIIINIGHWGSGDSYAIEGDSIVSARNDFINRPSYKTLKAVQTDRVYFCNMGLVNGPRSVIGLVYLAKAIYPDRFADIDPDAIRREYAQEFGIGDGPGVEWFYPPFEPVNATAAANTTGN